MKIKSQFGLWKRSKATKYLLRREHPLEINALVIFLRFGTLENDKEQWHSPTEVWKRTGIKFCTQHKMVKRWRANDFLVVKTPRLGGKQVLSPEQVEWLTSLDTLQQMSHLSLRQRAQVVQERFELPKFHATTVQDYYRRNNIKYKKPDYKFWKSSADIDDLRGQ